MHCLLCQKKKPKQIKISSKKGQELKCSLIIAKHFWFQSNTFEDSKVSICIICWNAVKDFHQFYVSVAEAHNLLESIGFSSSKLNQEALGEQLPNPESNSYNGLIESEIKLEIEDLELLPPIEIIENVNEKQHSTVQLTNEESIQQNSNVSIKIDATDSENDIPLSKLKECKVNVSIYKNTEATKISTIAQAISNESLVIECSPNKANESLSSNEVCKNNLIIRRKYKKRAAGSNTKLIRKKYDEIIAKFFERLQCTKCDLLFQNFGDMIAHYKSVHKDKTPTVNCCGRSFHERSTLSDHILCHLHPEYLKCSYSKCEKLFENNTELQKHEEFHKKLTNESELFHCKECSKSYVSKKNFHEHQASHLSKSNYRYTCAECGTKYATERRLKQHIRFKHKLSHVCDLCGKQITNGKALKRHMWKHSENPVKCDLCDKWFKHNDSLKNHKELMHNSKTQHQCSICEKIKPTLKALKEHISYCHTTEKRFQCNICEKAFKYKRGLNEHMNGHTKNEAYTCEFCLKPFFHKSALRRHLRDLHFNRESLQCKYCNALLKTPDSLKTHIKNLHGESKCENRCHICGLISVHAAALKRHIQRQHGQKTDKKENVTTVNYITDTLRETKTEDAIKNKKL